MKKEAVSVLKPHNVKTIKSKVEKIQPKRNIEKMAKTAVSEPSTRQKAKIVNIEKVDFGDALKKLKSMRSENVAQSKTEKNVKIVENSKKIKSHAVEKMASAVQKSNDETRVRSKKKLKIQAEEPTVPLKKQKKIGKVKTEEKKAEVTETEVTTKPKKQKSKVMMRKSIENVGDLKITKTHVLDSIIAIKQLSRIKEESKKSLLPTESNSLYLQVTCIKIAKTPRRQIRPYLPHQLAQPLDDIALFVPDLERGRGKDYEKTVDHWETILREKGVDCIKEIIPINRVKTEYSQYEMRRKLSMSFDYFLADGRICGHLTHLLGNSFFKRKSPPTPVKLGRDNLKGEINFALHKTCMEVHPYGNTHTMQVGIISMDVTKLAENVWAACEELRKEYPGGWENIRSIRLKTNIGPAIPIYMNLASKNDVPIPVVKPRRPRAYETVEGELTTVPGGAKVKLTPEGRIHVERLKDYGDPEVKEEEEEDEEDEDDVIVDDEKRKQIKKESDQDESEEEDDEE